MKTLELTTDAVVDQFNNKEYSASCFFNELLDLIQTWDKFKFPKADDKESVDSDEIRNWIFHSGRKVLLMEKLRRVLVFKGVAPSLIKEELVRVNKKLLNTDKNLKLNIKKEKEKR